MLKLDFFEFSLTKNKNPVFLRVLLNYISLVNILNDQDITPKEFHDILLYFCAKFSYKVDENGYLKIILMAKTTFEVYNLIFQGNIDKAFENVSSDVKNSIDLNFDNKNECGIGYSYQELYRVFINDYVVGRDKGSELPNILFYIRSMDEIQQLIGKLFIIPGDFKLNLNEVIQNSGINEFDNILLLKEDINININNPYFRFIKTVKGSNAIYSDLKFNSNEIYILEFKFSYKMNKDISNIENLGSDYIQLYNKNIYNFEKCLNFDSYKILYFYNYFESLGYKNISGYNLDTQKWSFLYLNPSCQIVSVTKLSSKVSKLEKRVTTLEQKINVLQADNESFKERMDNLEKLIFKINLIQILI